MALPPTPTFGAFKKVVAAYMNRDAKYLENEAPVITQAINNAKRFIERTFNFEYLKETVKLEIDLIQGGDLGNVYPAIPVKKIYGAILPGIALGAASQYVNANYFFPVEIKSEDYYMEVLKRRTEASTISIYQKVQDLVQRDSLGYFFLWRRNQKLFIYPNIGLPYNPSSVTATLRVYRWSDLYVNDDDTDFMLNYCPDYLLYHSIRMLNTYTKEDQRIPISNKMMDEAFQSLIQWDADIKGNDDDWNLE